MGEALPEKVFVRKAVFLENQKKKVNILFKKKNKKKFFINLKKNK